MLTWLESDEPKYTRVHVYVHACMQAAEAAVTSCQMFNGMPCTNTVSRAHFVQLLTASSCLLLEHSYSASSYAISLCSVGLIVPSNPACLSVPSSDVKCFHGHAPM